jgi:hypothetical protein
MKKPLTTIQVYASSMSKLNKVRLHMMLQNKDNTHVSNPKLIDALIKKYGVLHD